MASITLKKRTIVASAAALALGGATVGGLMAQEPTTGPREAKPQLMAPDARFIQQLSFADLVEEVSPAVVSIRTEAEISVRRRMQLPPGLERMLPPEFREEFGDGEDGEGPTRRAQGQGSGFFVDDQGHIVTNNHVIDGADEIFVVLENGEELPAELVGTDPSTDLSVLKVDSKKQPRYVKFSEDADLRVGDYVLAVGNPFGLGGSVTSGIVSAIDRQGSGPYTNFIQIDASINRGNSGGPTFDLRGNVVGVNTAIISPTGGNVGIGLAVPADVAAKVVDQLIDNGTVTRGWLGVSIGNIDDRLASALGLEDTDGALVQSVQKGSPAEKAGLKEGDVVRTLDGTDVGDRDGLTRMVGDLAPDTKVKVGLIRDGEEKTVTVTLGTRDPQLLASGGFDSSDRSGSDEEMDLGFGVTLSALTDGLRERLGLEPDASGAVVSGVERGSEAEEAGFREGMVLTRADNVPVKTPADVEKAMEAARKRGKEAVLVRVQTARQGAYFLAMPVSDGEG